MAGILHANHMGTVPCSEVTASTRERGRGQQAHGSNDEVEEIDAENVPASTYMALCIKAGLVGIALYERDSKQVGLLCGLESLCRSPACPTLYVL
jgi:hypothetical protein